MCTDTVSLFANAATKSSCNSLGRSQKAVQKVESQPGATIFTGEQPREQAIEADSVNGVDGREINVRGPWMGVTVDPRCRLLLFSKDPILGDVLRSFLSRNCGLDPVIPLWTIF
jgi:hypothetical protein